MTPADIDKHAGTASEDEMAVARRFGKKLVKQENNLRVTVYLYENRIFVDEVKVVGPRLVKGSTHDPR